MTDDDKDKRVHDLDAAGAGDVGIVADTSPFGPCPSCRAELHVGLVKNPITGLIEKALMHPVPFCSYYGETDPQIIQREAERLLKEN